MAKAQQKPKRDRGTRNSARRNGKAFGKNSGLHARLTGDMAGLNGVRSSGRGKPSGKSIVGFSKKRVEEWCAKGNPQRGIAVGMSLDEAKSVLVAERDRKKAARRHTPGDTRNFHQVWDLRRQRAQVENKRVGKMSDVRADDFAKAQRETAKLKQAGLL